MSSRQLPPLNALRAFEVCARTGSFSAAAIELGVTHGAVSRQVATLEAWFGHRLFIRAPRGIILNGPGRTFATDVSAIFDRLAEAAARQSKGQMRSTIRVVAPATFAMRWLIPRLRQFHDANPETRIEVSTSVTFAEPKGGYEVAIRRGPKSGGPNTKSGGPNIWDRHEATRFLDESDTIIASPRLLARVPLRTLDELRSHTLLSTETRPGEWSNWLEAAGLAHVPEAGHMRFDHFFVTLQAATDDLGLAIGPFPVLDGDLASGRFVTPFPRIRVPRESYHALVPADVDKTRALRSFVRWLKAQGEARRASTPARMSRSAE